MPDVRPRPPDRTGAVADPPALAAMTALDAPHAKLLALYLSVVGEAPPTDLGAELGVSLLTVYPVVDRLAARGYVDRRGDKVVWTGGNADRSARRGGDQD